MDVYKALRTLRIAGLNAIGTLTMTGGALSLVPHLVRQARLGTVADGMEVDSFYCVINGKKFSEDLVEELEAWDWLDGEVSGIDISQSRWHRENGQQEWVVQEYLERFEAFNLGERAMRRPELMEDDLINEGRAMNGLARNDDTSHKKNLRLLKGSTDEDVKLSQLHVGATGYVTYSSNLSYVNQRKFALGNIFEEGIVEIIRKRAVPDPDD